MSANTAISPSAVHAPIRRAVFVLLASVAVGGGACLWTVAIAPDSYRPFVAACIGAAVAFLCAVATVATYGVQADRYFRDRAAALDALTARLADEIIPAAVQRLRDGGSVDSALVGVAEPANAAHRHILRAFLEEVGRSERMRAAAVSACANAAGRMQALSTSMLADLRAMEDRYDGDVLGDLLKLDHRTAQAGRLADSIAVLTGARSGRRWTKRIVMESILRGAMGRISAYQRVRLHSTSNVAVAGHAAEGVIHALAELMDNATSFSPPYEEVHVYVDEVTAGVVVMIEDSGLVMSPAALRRAEKAVSTEPLDLTTLSGTRLGLAVVGSLARKYGLTVSFRPSSRGGTCVVVLIPRRLISQPEPGSAARTRPAAAEVTAGGTATALMTPPESASAQPKRPPSADVQTPEPEPTGAQVEEGEIVEQRGTGGLPKRRRGRTLAAAAAATPPAQVSSERRSIDSGAMFAAFRNAMTGGHAGAPQTDETPDDER